MDAQIYYLLATRGSLREPQISERSCSPGESSESFSSSAPGCATCHCGWGPAGDRDIADVTGPSSPRVYRLATSGSVDLS